MKLSFCLRILKSQGLAVVSAGIATVIVFAATARGDQLNLAGTWNVRLDRTGEGEKAGWAAKPLVGAQAVRLPGSLNSNGIGDDIDLNTPWMGKAWAPFATDARYAPYRKPGHFKMPCWLQPDKYFKGLAWYQREVATPASWQGKHIELNLERCHWKTTVYADGVLIGSQNSLATPHRYDLTRALPPGKHLLTMCVDNNYQVRVGCAASSVTDHSQGNWNGIVGDLSLRATDPIWLQDVQVYPDPRTKSVRVRAKLGNLTGQAFAGTLTLNDTSFDVAGNDVEATLRLGDDVELWDEFHPKLYKLRVRLDGRNCRDEKTLSFGLREIRAEGRTLLINGVPAFLRGTLDCAAFPKTGYPAMDVAEWRRLFKNCKAYGLNHMRFHSWCPPEAAFEAADREGVYLQVECGTWYEIEYAPAAPIRPWLLEETERIRKAYANHPSFVLLVQGNEPGSFAIEFPGWLNDTWIPAAREREARYLVAAGAHHPLVPNNDVHIPGFVEGFWYRYQGGFNTPPATTRNYESQIARRDKPCIAHETGQWCAFPNLNEIAKYTGCMKAHNFEIVRDFMQKNHLLERADDFLMASGKFQTEIYKEDNEAYLRTRGCAGYQMLGLNDFPGQGTALVGVTDVFYEDKGYAHPEDYRRFSGPVVPLAIFPKRVYMTDETFTAQIRIAQYSGKPIAGAKPIWQITDGDGKKLARGNLAAGDIPVGNSNELGTVSLPLAAVTKASKLVLHVAIPGTDWRNEWSFWVYPKEMPALQTDAVICRNKEDTIEQLARGASVLMLPDLKTVAGNTAGTFAPIFWNKMWFSGQREHTLGWLIESKHPAFRDFPTDFHSDWQWWDLMMHCKPMVLDALPPALRPLAEPIDDWNSCRRLATLFEAKVSKGKLLVCSMDLENDLEHRPVARQLRASLLAYAGSSKFQPKLALEARQIFTLFSGGQTNKTIVKVTCDSWNQSPSNPPAAAFDGDPSTLWHTEWKNATPGYPHELCAEFSSPRELTGVSLLPRQDGNPNGWVKEVEIQTSLDGKAWTTASHKELRNDPEWKDITFLPVRATFLKIRALSPQKVTDNLASFAEITPTARN